MYRLIANSKMSIYKCPKGETEFSLGTKFCENCGCNLAAEFIETPTCPKCGKTFPTGTVFCSEDGVKLVSSEQMIPKCVKCETVYTDGTVFCPLDGGKVIPEALRTGIDFDNAKEFVAGSVDKGKELLNKGNKSFSRLSKNQQYGIIGGAIAVIVLVIVLIATGGNRECIIGTWEGTIGRSTVELIYRSDGSFSRSDTYGNETRTYRGTFVFRDNSIIAIGDGWSRTSEVIFVDRNTILITPQPGVTHTFRRQR